MNFENIILILSQLLLLLSIIFSFFRFVSGPDPLNRLVGLDMISISGQGFLLIFMIEIQNFFLMDILLVWAILPFVGTASVCRLLLKRELK
jgi:multicomponent Na+:H+ antiporter subunit F